ncbi:hypothetical protein EB796_007307 [Bugula neritina]|uniref:Sushi domain-containing protein n=1 Tax=Bugula neritina TaxID=10212 RepID=A0A7J7KA01_BUGNE|nr:hypothetical protein EB796_007307 [Bugula neritina]
MASQSVAISVLVFFLVVCNEHFVESAQLCYRPEIPAFSKITPDSLVYSKNSTVTYTCKSGYVLDGGDPVRTCGEIKQFSWAADQPLNPIKNTDHIQLRKADGYKWRTSSGSNVYEDPDGWSVNKYICQYTVTSLTTTLANLLSSTLFSPPNTPATTQTTSAVPASTVISTTASSSETNSTTSEGTTENSPTTAILTSSMASSTQVPSGSVPSSSHVGTRTTLSANQGSSMSNTVTPSVNSTMAAAGNSTI